MEGLTVPALPDPLRWRHSPNIPLGDILRPSLSGSAISLPLDPGMPYTHFKYVTGVPSSEPGTGLTMSKLQALDVLIDRLVALSQKEAPARQESLALSDEDLDQLIQDLGHQLSAAMDQSIMGIQEDLGVQMGTPISHTGLVINTLA